MFVRLINPMVHRVLDCDLKNDKMLVCKVEGTINKKKSFVDSNDYNCITK